MLDIWTFGLKIARTLSHNGIIRTFLTGVVGPILYLVNIKTFR